MSKEAQEYVTLATRTTFLVPSLPNFIRIYGKENNGSIPIEDLDDDALKQIGVAYTEALIKLAKQKRRMK